MSNLHVLTYAPGMTHVHLALGVALALATCGERKGQVESRAKRSAETVIRAGAIHTMGPERTPMRSIAIGEGRVLAVGAGPHDAAGRDHA